MNERNPGKGASEGIKKITRTADRLARHVVNAENRLALRVAEHLWPLPNTEEFEEARTRRSYKLGVIKPYLPLIPAEVAKILLDLDTLPIIDKSGQIIKENGRPVTLYEMRKRSGEVQEVIDKAQNIKPR